MPDLTACHVIARASRRYRRRHAAAALAAFADAHPEQYEALHDAGELDPQLVRLADLVAIG